MAFDGGWDWSRCGTCIGAAVAGVFFDYGCGSGAVGEKERYSQNAACLGTFFVAGICGNVERRGLVSDSK